MTAQTQACRLGLAPRQRQMPAYSGALNYAYHLDAAKLAALLSRHAVQRLGVTQIADLVTGVEAGEDGRVLGVRTRDHGTVGGELFIDCSGHAALLIGGHCGVEWVSRSGTLFNDRALAAQVPVAADSRIESQTIGTAHAAGWLWDIGLPARRGIGCVYASEFMSDEQALDVLRGYISREVPDADAAAITPRQLSFPTGHRARFWDRNCIAIGLSAGFVEPLEASAIVMIELSLRALLDNFPASDEVLPLHAERFNQLFRTRWDRIVEFLKLHYLLSRRDEPYWQKHRDLQTVPERLSSLMRLWQDQPPSAYDFPLAEEIFPAASFQYVYYGMGGALVADDASPLPSAAAQIEQVQQRARGLAAALPTNRAYLHGLRAGGRVAEPREQAV